MLNEEGLVPVNSGGKVAKRGGKKKIAPAQVPNAAPTGMDAVNTAAAIARQDLTQLDDVLGQISSHAAALQVQMVRSLPQRIDGQVAAILAANPIDAEAIAQQRAADLFGSESLQSLLAEFGGEVVDA